MHIALVNPEYPSPSGLDHGGIATFTYTMAQILAAGGHKVHILVRKGASIPPLSPAITVCNFMPVAPKSPLRFIYRKINGPLYWERCFSVGLRNALLSIAVDDPLDIVEVPEYNGLAFALTPPLPFPVAVHFHTPSVLVDYYNNIKLTARHKNRYAFEAKALCFASGFRCPSEALAHDVSVRYAIAPHRIALIRHPFDTTVFDFIEKNHQDTCIDILFAGRLERRKGAEIVKNYIQKIVGLDPRIRFTFAGELSVEDRGNYRSSIERILSPNDRKRVYFLGPVKRVDLPVVYCRSSIMLLPSLFENAPYVLLEAMAARLPVIGARCGGIPEIIRHNETGLLFDPENPVELLDCIKRIIENNDFAKSLADRAYDELRKNFQPQTIADANIAFYNGIIASFNGK